MSFHFQSSNTSRSFSVAKFYDQPLVETATKRMSGGHSVSEIRSGAPDRSDSLPSNGVSGKKRCAEHLSLPAGALGSMSVVSIAKLGVCLSELISHQVSHGPLRMRPSFPNTCERSHAGKGRSEHCQSPSQYHSREGLD